VKYGYQDKFEKHETPVGQWSARAHEPKENLYATHRQPEDEYAALMETLPHQQPPMSADEREADWFLFQQKIESAGLTSRETIIIDAIVYAGMSLTQAADHLARCEGTNHPVSKTEIARIRDRGLVKLRKVFKEEQ